MNYSITIADCGELFVATITDRDKNLETKVTENSLNTLALLCAARIELRERQKREAVSVQPASAKSVTLETYTLP